MLAGCAMLGRVTWIKQRRLPASAGWRRPPGTRRGPAARTAQRRAQQEPRTHRAPRVRRALRGLGALAILAAVVLTQSAESTVARPGHAPAQTAAGTHAATAADAAGSAAEPGAFQAARTVVTFTWGGGLKDQMGALSAFRQYRMHATFYVPSGLVCQPASDADCARLPYLTLAEVRQIAAEGNEIGGLSVEHIPLTGIPAAEAQREICDDRLNLSRWGFRVTDFAYPFALVTGSLQVLAQRCGYNSGLGTGQLRGAGQCPNCPWAETIPPRNPYLLRAPIEVASVGTTWSPGTFEKIVTDAEGHGGGWIIFTIHDICAQACALGVTQPELSSVLGWLARQASRGVTVRTVHQVIGGPVRPVTAGPRPPRIPPPGVTNSRLSAVTAGSIPACFQTSQYGTNHATFQYRSRSGPGDAGAELISLTDRRSGTAQLLPTLDLGACAPTVLAGHSYTLGAWYKSTQPVVFNAYYRTPVGTWTFWVTSPPMGASRNWTRARWTAPAVPSGATAVSFGLALSSDGTLATTRYSLVPVHDSDTGLIVAGVVVAALAGAAVAARALRGRRGRQAVRSATARPPGDR
jgi:peptidoglycan/xylan/chitin deacetylase (PgdA/CDA1 family)